MELTLSGDARAVYDRVLEVISKKADVEEAIEELKALSPLKDREEILKRQDEVREKIELAKKIEWDELKALERFEVRTRFFDDRVYVAADDEEYFRASKLGVCEVVRERGSHGTYAIVLNDFVKEISLPEFAPELIAEALISGMESLRTLSQIEKRLKGDDTVERILREVEELQESYRKMTAFDGIERRAFELEEKINREIEKRLSEIKLTLTADELLKMIEEGRVGGEVEREVEKIVSKYEAELHDMGIYDSVFHRSYPVRVDTEALLNAIRKSRESHAIDYYLKCRKVAEKVSVDELNEKVAFYRRLALYRALIDLGLTFPEPGDGIAFINGRNLFIEDPQPVSYCVGSNTLFPHHESTVILTGANSGGKTSLLDLICQIAILFHMGLPVNAERAECTVYDEIFYFRRKRTGYGSGAFERALRSLVKAVSGDGRKLILIDEFEAITEPGAGARILAGVLRIANEKGHHTVLVSHLGEEFSGLDFIRIDGIEARGLDENFNLIVDRQPVFGKMGRSTPELIVERLMEKSRGEQREILREVLEELRKLRESEENKI